MKGSSGRVLLTVSVGSADLAAFRRSVGAIEGVLREKFPEYRHCAAILSEKTAALLQEKYDVKVSTLTEILLAFSEESMEEILLLPILLSAGKEFSSILTITERFPDLPIKVLSPLLSTEDDLSSLVEVLKEKTASFDEDSLLVFVAHGGEFLTKLQQLLFAEKDCRILVGAINGAPTFYEVLRYARTSPQEKIILLPLLLSAGRHAQRDIFGEEQSWKSGFLAAGFSVATIEEGLAEYPGIRELFLKKAEEGML